MSEVFVGRQPIFTQNLDVLGYELLFRSSQNGGAKFDDGDKATTQVLINTFMEFGLDRLVGKKGLAFINMTRTFLTGENSALPKHKRIVLEVLEDLQEDPIIIEAVKKLYSNGYQIALDDVVEIDKVRSFLPFTHFLKYDLMGGSMKSMEKEVEGLKKQKIKLLAEKVETLEEFDICKELGFDYFQGYFLSKPNVVAGKRIPGNKLNLMRILAKLHSIEIEFSEIETIISQDVTLSYKLLKLLNSAYYSRGQNVKGLRQALTLLGIEQLRSWVNMLMLTEIDNKPKELMTTAMIRAKMCEILGEGLQGISAESKFIVGLFSVLDALLDMPLEEILSQIPLSVEIKDALLERKGGLGNLLKCVVAYERGEWENVQQVGIEAQIIKGAYLKSLDWAGEVLAVIG